MGDNFCIAYGALAYDTTASNEDAVYPASNLQDYSHPKRSYRSTVTSSVNIVCAMASPSSVKAIVLYDCNFTSVTIQANATDVWTSPSFSQTYTIGQDVRTLMGKIFIDLRSNALTYQYVRILIPSVGGAQSIIDGASYFRIGSVMIAGTVLEFQVNPSWPYQYTIDMPIKTNEFETGGFEQVELGYSRWKASFGWDVIKPNEESDLHTLSQIPRSTCVAFWENMGNTYHTYLCRRMDPVKITWSQYQVMKADSINFREV